MLSVLKVRIPVSPPSLTIFLLRSLTLSSLTAPMRVQPLATPGSVDRRTRAMARFSPSFAVAIEVAIELEVNSKAPIQMIPVFIASPRWCGWRESISPAERERGAR